MSPHPPSIRPKTSSIAALVPLENQGFRMLWSVWLVANICMWMNDVAAAWMMLSMNASPLLVALVQTASTLPVFLLGLPSGALADTVDRRRYFIVTQFWVAIVAALLCVAIIAGAMSPMLLLALTFANGIGLAMRWPSFSALIPELVPRPQLPAALALNGVAMNVSRIVGPLIAGTIIASLGSVYVFVLNAVLSVISGFVIVRWRREHVPNPLGRERLGRAMRVGLQFVGQSARLKGVLLRIFLFFFQSSALVALLPLVAKQLPGGSAGTFAFFLACMGVGAIVAAFFLPRAHQAMSRDAVVMAGTLLQAGATIVVSLSPNLYVAAPALFFAGMSVISTANSLSVSAQLALPDWVRARGMSMYQMAIMGGAALGAALWGQLATLTSVQTALVTAPLICVLAMTIAHRLTADRGVEEDLTPSRVLKAPVADVPPETGRVVVTTEYRIDPARASEFVSVMQESRRNRLRQGALSCDLLSDISDPGRYVEQVIDESWVEHLRRFDRVTAADVALRERKFAFHIGEGEPRVTRYVVESGSRG